MELKNISFSSSLNLKRDDYSKEDWIKICSYFGLQESCNEIRIPR